MKKNGSERAILLVNMINSISHTQGDNFFAKIQDVIPFIQGELQYFRERMRPVIFVNQEIIFSQNIPVAQRNFARNIIQELSPRTDEFNLTTPRPNAFFETNLLSILEEQKVGQITLVGTYTHTNILLTAAAALDHNYHVVVPETCVASPNEQDHQAGLRIISRYI